MADRDGFEGNLELGVGLDPVQPGGLGARSDPAPGNRAFVRTREECVFPCKGSRPIEILDGIAVHLDAAVGEEEPEAFPMVGDVGELFAEAALGRDAGALLLQPDAEGLAQRRGACLSFASTPFGRATADVGLDGVEFGDPAQALGCDLGAAAVVDFAKAAPSAAPAVCQPQRRAALAAPAGQPVVAGIAVDPQDKGLPRVRARCLPLGKSPTRSSRLPRPETAAWTSSPASDCTSPMPYRRHRPTLLRRLAARKPRPVSP